MESERPKLPAVCFMSLDQIGLVTHPRADIVGESNIVCKNIHIGAALKCAGDVFPQSPAPAL